MERKKLLPVFNTRTEKVMAVILALLFLLQTGVIILFNLTQLEHHIGFDTSTFLYNAVTVWNEKSLILKDWSYQTTLALDNSVPLAALFYGITNDIFVSYGLANSLFTILLLWIFNGVLKRSHISLISRLVCLNMVLLLHYAADYSNANPLLYGDVLYLNNAAYNVRTILALLLIYIYIGSLNEEKNPVLLYVLTGFLCLVAGLSSGFWILVTICIPLTIHWVFTCFFKKNPVNYRALFILITASVLIAAGKIISVSVLHFSARDSGMVLITIDKFWKNMGSILMGWLDLLSALSISRSIAVFSAEGIYYGLSLLLALLLPAVGLYMLFRGGEKTNGILSAGYIIGFNFLMFAFLDTTYGSPVFEIRYLIILVFMAVLILGCWLDRIDVKKVQTCAVMALAVIMIPLNIISDSTFYHTKNNLGELQAIAEAVRPYESPVVYFYGDSAGIDARNIRAVDTSKTYKFVSSNRTVDQWGDSRKYIDAGEWNGPTLVVSRKEEYADLPTRLIENAAEVTSVNEYSIFLYERNPFDFLSGVHKGLPVSVDNLSSPGIIVVDDSPDGTDSKLENSDMDGRYVMYGPYAPAVAGTYDFTLHYKTDPEYFTGGFFDVAVDNQTLGMVQLEEDREEITIENISIPDQPGRLEYRIYLEPDSAVTVSYVEITDAADKQ